MRWATEELSMKTKKTRKLTEAPGFKVKLVRPLSRKMADRLRVLVDGCSALEEAGKLTLYSGSKTFAGPPTDGLIHELNLLLHGFKTDRPCRGVKMIK